MASSEENKTLILADLTDASKDKYVEDIIATATDILNWKKLNT